MITRGRHAGRRVATCLVLAGLMASACTGGSTTLIGVRKVSLPLAFKDSTLAPVPKSLIIKIVQAPPEAFQQLLPGYPQLLPGYSPAAAALAPPIPPQLCPQAVPGSTPDEPAAVAITRPPREGTYLEQNEGTIKVTGTAVPLTLPYPPYTKLTISNVKRTDTTDVLGHPVAITTFQSERQVTAALGVKSYYSYNSSELDLVREEDFTGTEVSTFEPTPPIEVLPFAGPGGSWNSAGIDNKSSATETIQGAIAGRRETLDVCGKVVDTLKVSTTENHVNLSDGTQSGSDPDRPNLQNYALQYGALVLRREEHSTRVIKLKGSTVTVHVDVISRLLSVEPTKLPF